MASLRKENDRGRVGWRLQFRQNGARRSVWLGSMSKRAADTVMRHVDELLRSSVAGAHPDPATTAWATSLDGRLRDSLVRIGLVDPRRDRSVGDEGRLLKPYCDHYIAGRSDLSDGTLDNYGHARRLLVEMFGATKPLAAITAADAERWRRWLLARPVQWDADGNVIKTMAVATVSKHVKRAKTMFAEAVKDRLLPDNPFAEIRTGSEANRERDHFIDRASASKVLQACPDATWRLIFALARFGGLRRCEILAITWGDIQWDTDRMRIDSPKTGLRFCPIFPELLPYLRDAFDAAPVGDVRCVSRYPKGCNLGTLLNGIVQRAGLEPWAKTMQNLRATRRTELQETVLDHVVNAWMGHSSKTAEKHYLQVTDDHFAAGSSTMTGEPIALDCNELQADDADTIDEDNTASTIGGVAGGVIPAYAASISNDQPMKKAPGIIVPEAFCDAQMLGLATPLGLEPRMTEPKSVVLPITPRGSDLCVAEV